MKKNNNHGGKREGAGRDPLPYAEKKHPINLSIKGDIILLAGGKTALKQEVIEFINNKYNQNEKN